LKEYAAMQTIVNAKRRLNSSSSSILREMDKDELESFRADVKESVISENKEIEQIEGVADTIDQTLTAITGPEGSQVDDDIEELVEAAKEGDLTDVSLADQETESTQTSDVSVDNL
jgi:phosphotransferase system IIB component